MSAPPKDQIEITEAKCENLKERNRQLAEAEAVRQKENVFLRSQVVKCLENLGYEVMDDLEVIDFEKEKDFLLKIRGQENFLNLKFKEDGSMRYVFQIPEEKDQLSSDQTKMKLHEMQVTCDEFKGVLRDLERMGLKMSLRSERPVEVASLLTLPESKRGKTGKRSSRRSETKDVRKKYLSS
jgi:hypothetical protein